MIERKKRTRKRERMGEREKYVKRVKLRERELGERGS